ncbi:MAG: TonB-dependent receptor [Acidobacteriota bacterium]|nr:TonB-dependent receptor [Acidobacteriota bacterium]
MTDPNGAVVTGATVQLVRSDTAQEVRTVQTNDEGVYQFLEIEPSTYNVIITAAGFAESRISEAKVEPNRNLRLDAQLNLTGTTEEVTVTAAQQLLDRETPTLGTTVDPRRVQGLPLNGRNILDLALLQPGVQTGAGGAGIRANGQRGTENNFQLDGANNNEVAVGGTAGVNPRPDAVQEFRLLTSNFEAEFGRNSGTVINVVTRSGSNDFHGNARIFFRPTVLSAARYFDQNDPSDRPRAGTQDDFRRRFERKEFGGNIGGPIYLPRFGEGGPAYISGKNRSFFFVDYEGRRQLVGDTRTISNLPTTEERQGIFTRQASNPLIDPATNSPFPTISTSGTQIRQQIPSSRFSPIAQYYLNFLPIPNTAGQATVGADEIENFDIITARVDPYVSDRQSFGVTFNYFDRLTLSPFAFGGASVPGFPGADPRTTYNAVLRHTFTFSPTVVNSFLVGYARNEQAASAPSNAATPSQIGFTANFVAAPQFAGPPFVRLFDRNISIGNSIQGPQARTTENFQIQDSVSWATGNHRFKFGIDGTKYKQQTAFVFINQGLISFSGQFEGNTSGDDLADLLLGVPNFIQFGSAGDRDFQQFGGAVFAQDNWRVSDEFTLSLGLRYEYVGPLSDKFNRVAYYRPNAAVQGITSQLLTSGQLRTFEGVTIPIGTGRRAPAGLLYPGDPDPDLGGTVPPGGVAKDLNNFAPRVGFAYSPRASETGMFRNLLGEQQTVIRGGFGIFYGAIIGDTALQQLTAPGYQGTNAFFSELGGTLADPFAPDPFPLRGGIQPTAPNPFLSASAAAIGVSPVTRTTSTSVARLSQLSRAIDPFIRTPYTYQYNLTIERSFLNDYIASVSYVGNRGLKLFAIEQLNPAYGTLFPYPDSIPAAQRFGPSTAGANVNARRLNSDFGLGISQQVAAGNSWYNALQANLQRRLANGLLFQAAYTFSKSITDTGGTDTNRGTLDLLDRRFGRGLSSDDVPHRFVGSFVYDFPFFRNSSGIVRTFLGGWSLGGIASFESGRPFSVGNVADTVATGGGIITFADLGAAYQNLDPRGNREREFNPDAFVNFTCPAPTAAEPQRFANCARRGTSGVNQFRANNGLNNFDFILSKNTRLWSESSNLELRFEAFNAFNHTQFTTLNLSLNPSNIVRNADGSIDPNRTAFGKFTAARESRVIQLGARFSF